MKSRYVGIANAHGRFITFMEAYDRIEPRAIEVMVHAMLDFNAHLVQLRTPRRFFKVLGNKYQDEFEPDMASRLIEGDEFRTLASYVGMDSYINPSCRGKLYITSKLLDASNMDFKLIWGEDQIFNIQYLRECRSMVFCDYIGYNYRREHTSARNYKYSALREYKNIHQLKRMLGQDEECINSEIKMLLRYHLRALITELGYTGQAVEMILEDELRDPLWRSVGETSTPTQLVEEAMNYIQRNPVRYIKKRLLK